MLELPQLQELTNALGWTLVHFLWQGLAIAAAYWLVCCVTRTGNSQVRYWSGMVAFLVSAVVPMVTFSFYWSSGSAVESATAYAVPIMPVGGDLSLSTLQLLSAGMESALPFVVVLWALGVALLSVRAFLGWIGAHRLVRLDTSQVSQSLQDILHKLMNSLEVRQAVQVLRSARVKVPTVVGWLKPVILLPVAVINRLPEDQLEMIIAHELGHIRRYDYLLNLLQVVIETLFFYHPAVRWMSRQVRQEREHCCDDLVIANCNQPVLYARALANLEIMRDEPVPAFAMAATGGDLIHRLHRIVRQDFPGKQSGLTQLAVMLGVATLVTVSANQGMEVRNHFLEASSSSTQLVEFQEDAIARSRPSWIEGVSAYSHLSAENAAKSISANTADLVVDRNIQSLPKESVTENAETAPVQSNPAEKSVDTVFADLSGSAAINSMWSDPTWQESGSTEELEIMLASTSLPSKTRFNPELREANLQDSVKVEFEIKAHTVVPPVYPFKARRKHINGFVRLEFSVDEKGRAVDIEVVEAQPAEIFEKSAINALEKWVFEVDENYSGNRRLFQKFDFDMEGSESTLSKRERRCEIAGSRICGLKVYN